MCSNRIEHLAATSSAIVDKFESTSFNSIRKVLTNNMIYKACRDANYQFRKRRLTPVITILHMITAGIWQEDSFNGSWQVLWTRFASYFPELAGTSPVRGTVAKARNRIPCEVWQNIFNTISQKAQDLSSDIDKWRSHRVVHVDGTCLTLENVPKIKETFGHQTGCYGTSIYPLTRIVALTLANTMTVISYAMGRYNEAETTLLKKILDTLNPSDLLIGDRHFAGANLYWLYQQYQLEFITRMHQRIKLSRVKRLWSYGENDFVGYMKTGDLYRRQTPEMPTKVKVRFICVQVVIRGKSKPIWLVTSLLNNDDYPASEIAEQYLSRWRIETLFKEFKLTMGADIIRSKSVNGVRNEVAAKFTAMNIVRSIMIEAGIKHDVDPIRISFIHAVRAVCTFAPAMALRSPMYLPMIYKGMLKEISSQQVPYRPGRIEPRMFTHEGRYFTKLKISRAQWRLNNAA